MKQQVSLADVQAIYDRAYQYDGLMGTDLDGIYDRVTKEALLAFAEPLEGKRLLDIGTGIGNLWQYTPPKFWGHALDISFTGVRRAKDRFPLLLLSVSTAGSLPYPNNSFDIVVAADTIEHTPVPGEVLREIARVLRPQGILCASFPIPNSLRKWGRNQFIGQRPNIRLLFRLLKVLWQRTLLFGRPDFQPIDHDYSPDQWIVLLENAGFIVDRVHLWPEPPKLPIVTLVRALKSGS